MQHINIVEIDHLETIKVKQLSKIDHSFVCEKQAHIEAVEISSRFLSHDKITTRLANCNLTQTQGTCNEYLMFPKPPLLSIGPENNCMLQVQVISIHGLL